MIHPDSVVRKEVRTLLAADDVVLTEASELSLMDPGRAELILVAWSVLNPAVDSLRWIKKNGAASETRVIVLSEQVHYSDAVRSLRYGADDCVMVPLQGDELLVRIRVALDRPRATAADGLLSAGPIVMDRRVHRVSVNDESLELAPTEFRLLAFLLENQGRVFSRNELLTRAWSSNVKAGLRTVDVHVRRLRQQLEPYRCAEIIQTVRGFGYRLRAD